MQSLLGLTQKRAKELVPGELFLFSIGSSDEPTSLAILLDPGKEGEPVYGVLASPDFETPLCWYTADENDYCLSYGPDWLIEERPNIETVSDGDRDARLFFDKAAKVLKFMPSRGFSHHALYFDLVASKLHQISSRAARLTRWVIWASLDQYKSPRAEALFEYPPKAAA